MSTRPRSGFLEAYRLKPDPSFLFNIAQCHRKLGELNAALDFYRKYLRSLPNAPNRVEVERMISELRARASDADATPVAPIVPPIPVPAAAPAPVEAAAPGPVAPLTIAPPAPDVISPPPVPPEPERAPAYRHWWFWTALGVVAATAVVAGVALASSSDNPYSGTLAPGVLTLRSP